MEVVQVVWHAAATAAVTSLAVVALDTYHQSRWSRLYTGRRAGSRQDQGSHSSLLQSQPPPPSPPSAVLVSSGGAVPSHRTLKMPGDGISMASPSTYVNEGAYSPGQQHASYI